MAAVKLDHGISYVDAEYMQPGIAVAYILHQGEQVAIIETGTARSVPDILAAVEADGLSAEAVRYVIPTHVHLDHAGGAGELIHRCPSAELVIHPAGARHMIDPSKLEAGTKAVYGDEQFEALYGTLRPVPAERVIEAPDGFELDLNGRRLRFLDTPGHARHHFCVYDETSRGIFSGDTFGLCYPDLDTEQGPFIFATTTPVQFDPEAMKSSMQRLLALEPEWFYLTHFGRVRPTSAIREQLFQSVDDMSRIALEEQAPEAGRAERIESRIMDSLLYRLNRMGCHRNAAYCRAKLANDANLNAQGLEVWLGRLAKS